MRYILTSLLAFYFTFSLAQFPALELPAQKNLSEPDVAISLKKENNMVISSSTGEMFYSDDSGKSWNTSSLGISADGVTVVSDNKGVFYAFATKGEEVVGFKSKDSGASWEEEGRQRFSGLINYQVVNNINNGSLGFTCVVKSEEDGCKNTVYYSDLNGGKKWGKIAKIAEVSCEEQTITGSALGFSPDDRMYVAYLSTQTGILMDRSYDKGKTWLYKDISVADYFAGDSLLMPGLNEHQTEPQLILDVTSTQYRGGLYLTWDDKRPTAGTNIYFISSRNNGDYWNTIGQVNEASDGQHFMPVMAQDHEIGVIYILYYQTESKESNATDVIIAYSIDGGASFVNKKLTSESFQIDQALRSGLSIKAHNGNILASWTKHVNGKATLITSMITQKQLVPELKIPSGKRKK
ncbi:WD40/YVTN/BNR-like repeat-containing protein [Fulvivirga sediminis]|uniref:Exo-alpha-sialidase n=1 Tax=Fulvivirga sediminis TaxID=2803949 RepID=A0A937F8T3_9BACT|nr:sialidase family protein [Fulvivirga sediminis]MBL3656714.1 exo-alpha-sialidase [Fulvivirga sediminis]